MNVCDHTLHALDSHGRPTGSWTIRQRGGDHRVECATCGRVYGRLSDPNDDTATQRREYLLQQQRLACPGCGEQPFTD